MRKIFGSDAIHMLPLPNGFIIAVKQDERSGHFVVSYKMATLDTDALNAVTRNVYLVAKFGNNFKRFESTFKDYLNCKTILLPDGRVFSAYPDGRAAIYSPEVKLEWEGLLKYREYGPADVALSGDCIWASFPESNTLIRYNLHSMREELRIGDTDGSAFSYPYGIWIQGDKMLVCNADSNRIIEVNLNTFAAFDYAQFDEPVRQYIKVDKTEIVQLDSGIYTL